jgi:hypothetical protein
MVRLQEKTCRSGFPFDARTAHLDSVELRAALCRFWMPLLGTYKNLLERAPTAKCESPAAKTAKSSFSYKPSFRLLSLDKKIPACYT